MSHLSGDLPHSEPNFLAGKKTLMVLDLFYDAIHLSKIINFQNFLLFSFLDSGFVIAK